MIRNGVSKRIISTMSTQKANIRVVLTVLTVLVGQCKRIAATG
jgi:hypothetical protein